MAISKNWGLHGNYIHRPQSYDMVAGLRPVYLLCGCMEPLGRVFTETSNRSAQNLRLNSQVNQSSWHLLFKSWKQPQIEAQIYNVYTYIYICVCKYMSMHIQINLYRKIYIYIYIYMHACASAHVRTYISIYLSIHTDHVYT